MTIGSAWSFHAKRRLALPGTSDEIQPASGLRRWFMIAEQPKDCRRCQLLRRRAEPSGQSAWIEPQILRSAIRGRARSWRFICVFWNSRETVYERTQTQEALQREARMGCANLSTWTRLCAAFLTWWRWCERAARQNWQKRQATCVILPVHRFARCWKSG